MSVQVAKKKGHSAKKTLHSMWEYRWIYLMLIPCIAYFVIFKYVPMYGIQLAFKDYFLKRIAGLRGVALKLRPVKGLNAALVGDIKQSADQRCFSATFRDVPTSGEKRHQRGNKQDS